MHSASLSTPESPTGTGRMAFSRQRRLVLCLLLVLITIGVYNGVSHNGFINLDDNVYLTSNPSVQAGLSLKTIKWALTTYDADNWHPLTWMSHALDWELFGKNASGHHYVNALFHALNAVLLFLLLESATGFAWRSLFVALLFAVHPVNVESVAWAAERKNVLSMLFFLLALMAYGRYAKQPSVKRYSSVALLYVLGLLAKPQVITFPFVLLLWDYWPLQRLDFKKSTGGTSGAIGVPFWRLVLEKIPLFFISAADAFITMHAQQNAMQHGQESYTLPLRFANALVSYTRYVAHAFWPAHLSPAYPHLLAIPLWQAAACGVFLLLISFLAITLRKGYLLIGWLWFLGILVPMIGVVQVGDQAMADRYAYIPFIGLFWIAAWSAGELCAGWRISSGWLAVPATIVIAGCALITVRQVSYWHDSEALWRYALSVAPDRNFMAHNFLAGILSQENRHDEAIAEYRAAEKAHNYPLTQVVQFADYELRHNHVADAIEHAHRVVAGSQEPAAREMAFRVLGIGYTQLAKPAEAKENYQNALQINPQDPYALMGMGLLAYRTQDYPTAVDFFSRTAAVDPSDFDYLLLANALAQAGRESDASAAYARAQRASTNWNEALKKAHWFLTN